MIVTCVFMYYMKFSTIKNHTLRGGGCGLLCDHTHSTILCRYMSTEVYVIVHVSKQVIADVWGGLTEVANELAFGHLVLDVRACQVHTQENERVADYKYSVYIERRGERRLSDCTPTIIRNYISLHT